MLWVTGDALRHNDEAAYINGALQIAQNQLSPWHAPLLFDYDMQYASYWLIAAVLRFSGYRSPVLVTNYAQAIAFCLSFGVLILCKLRSSYFSLILPLLLCPILVTSVPFFETGVISLTFLFLAFAITCRGRPIRQASACVLIAIAAACRADVVLAVPAFLLTEMSRRDLRGLLTSPFAWAVSVCSILPPLIGKLLTPNVFGAFQAEPSPFKVVAAFIVFGLGLTIFALLTWSSLYFFAIAARKPVWRLYYTIRGLSPLVPFTFYLFQLQTPQHFFLTIACYVFTISERRFRLVFWWLAPRSPRSKVPRLVVFLVVVIPWFVGIKAPSLGNSRPTIELAQNFPTSHGHFPMGAYGYFMLYARANDYILDHNEKIFLAAQNVKYETCGGAVPILFSPMYNYLELAVRLHGMSPTIVWGGPHDVSCPQVYADARSLILNRKSTPVQPDFRDLLGNASLITSFKGQAILSLGRSPTNFGILLRELAEQFAGREFEFYVEPADAQFQLKQYPNGGVVYASSTGECAITPDAFGAAVRRDANGMRIYFWNIPAGNPYRSVRVICSAAAEAGQIVMTLPAWMSK